MKLIYKINKIALIVTLVLYVTLIFGLYAQVVLGTIQIISAIVLFFYWKRMNSKIKERLIMYWSLVIAYGVGWLFNWDNFNDDFKIIFGVMILPMSLAIFFVYILRITKNHMA